MPRVKKTPITDKVELQPIAPQETNPSFITPASDSSAPSKIEKKKAKMNKKTTKNEDSIPVIQEATSEVRKPKFKEIHTKDSVWLENDIYQTIADLTDGNKGKKALIINKALKDYFKKNKLELKPLRVKEKKH